MTKKTRRSVLAAGVSTIWLAGCAEYSTSKGASEESPTSQTRSPTETPSNGGRVDTTTSDAEPDLVVYNESEKEQPTELLVRNPDGEETFEKQLSLNPEGTDGDRWFRSNTFSRDSGVLSENQKDEWTIEASTEAARDAFEFIYNDGKRAHVHIYAETIEFGVIE